MPLAAEPVEILDALHGVWVRFEPLFERGLVDIYGDDNRHGDERYEQRNGD